MESLADEWNVTYLDLSQILQDTINWDTDTADGGIHLNCRGAEKVTAYLGDYLAANFKLPDHRRDDAYQSWNEDWTAFFKALNTTLK